MNDLLIVKTLNENNENFLVGTNEKGGHAGPPLQLFNISNVLLHQHHLLGSAEGFGLQAGDVET
jgi:hypothetical protein